MTAEQVDKSALIAKLEPDIKKALRLKNEGMLPGGFFRFVYLLCSNFGEKAPESQRYSLGLSDPEKGLIYELSADNERQTARISVTQTKIGITEELTQLRPSGTPNYEAKNIPSVIVTSTIALNAPYNDRTTVKPHIQEFCGKVWDLVKRTYAQ